MNLEEALDIIDTDPCYIGLPESRKGVSYDDYFEAKGLVMEAAESHIPKKPLKESLAERGCPRCNGYLNFDTLNDNLKWAPKYCSNCGQKIDWEVQDELY